ncbi:MAG: Nif3-like dinuclear metal center hexameric protein [Lachnospiraceae bacterium]|nr:Nif3-like dinuclear metal center hexameric protein [Lachnospiraceae bacterium]
MVCSEIISLLQEQSPENFACDWDNVGLLVGDFEQEVRKVYIALDATEETIAEAVAEGADLLLTHHPMIFRGLKKVNTQDFTGRRVVKLIRNNISYYAMHTNFDVKGMAGLAAERLGLAECKVLDVTCKTQESEEGIGRVGRLVEEMTLESCIGLVKRSFAVDTVKVFGDLQKNVRTLAVSPGSGKSVISCALRAGADVLVTGDIDHHEGIDAADQGMAIIDAGHYGVEKLFIPYMARYLAERAKGVEVVGQPVKQPFCYI